MRRLTPAGLDEPVDVPTPTVDLMTTTPAPDAPEPSDSTGPGLTVCSLCAGETLGASDAHPGGQLARLEELASTGVTRLTRVECLDECERGDVVVVRPAAHRRAAGAAPVWLERLAGDELTGELADFLRAGGPGACPVPRALRALEIPRDGATTA